MNAIAAPPTRPAPLRLVDSLQALVPAPAAPELLEEIRALKRQRQAVILAHNYQVPDIQDVADFVGDSLGLAQEAARTDAPIIVMCGVVFMAETAKILCPHRTVLIPDTNAGCSLADSISVEELRAWKNGAPLGYPVMAEYAMPQSAGLELDRSNFQTLPYISGA